MASIQIKLTADTWTQVTTNEINALVRQTSGNSSVLYLKSDTLPTGFDVDTPIMASTAKSGSSYFGGVESAEFVYAIAINEDATISVTEFLSSAYTYEQLASKDGAKFNLARTYNLSTARPLYLLVENPVGSGVSLELLKRFFQSDSDGVDLLITWDYDVSNAVKTSITPFNENDDFIGVNDSSIEVSILHNITEDPSTFVITLDDDAVIDDAGTFREASFIPTSGVGNNASGDVNPETGFRTYGEGKGFLLKATSRGNANLVNIGYTHIESK